MKTRKVKGFTLIELIVVIAIIAVLAAILIPALMGWVTKASLRTANSNAKAIANNSATVVSDLEASGIYLTGAGTYSCADISFSNSYTNAEFKAAVEKAAGVKGASWGVQFDSEGIVLAAAYKKDSSSPYVGQWPTENNAKGTKGIDTALADAQKTTSTTTVAP